MSDDNKAPVAEAELESFDFLKKEAAVAHFLSTGCTLLDLAIADRLPGGIPAGRITQIYGDESTAKTVIGAEAAGSAQRQGGACSVKDVEGTWDAPRMNMIHGIIYDKQWEYSRPTSIENLFDDHLTKAVDFSAKHRGKPSACLVDSLSALGSEAELKAKMTDATMGTSRAKQLSLAFRKHLSILIDTLMGTIFIDQTRTNVGVSFGEQSTVSGGSALKFYASVRIKLTHLERLTNSHGRIVGIKVGFFIRKNKVAAPFREGHFRLLFDYGIDDVSTNLEWLHECDPEQTAPKKDEPKASTVGMSAREKEVAKEAAKEAKKRRAWVFKDLKGQGLDDLARKVEDAGREKELRDEVERVWRVVYSPLERKPRVRFDS
jgi:recombination protein RecA